MTKITAKVRVKFVIEVPVTMSWPDSCSISQIHDQAVAEAKGKLLNGRVKIDNVDFRTLAAPEVDTVLVKTV